jgi:hypothetical protein
LGIEHFGSFFLLILWDCGCQNQVLIQWPNHCTTSLPHQLCWQISFDNLQSYFSFSALICFTSMLLSAVWTTPMTILDWERANQLITCIAPVKQGMRIWKATSMW